MLDGESCTAQSLLSPIIYVPRYQVVVCRSIPRFLPLGMDRHPRVMHVSIAIFAAVSAMIIDLAIHKIAVTPMERSSYAPLPLSKFDFSQDS